MRHVLIGKAGGGWSLAERTRPRPTADDLVVRVLASGVCHMDVRQANGEMGDDERIPGHEFVGEVVALGSAVTGYAIGDRVGATWHQRWCRTCPDCVRGRLELCRSAFETGIYRDGGHAEYALVHAGSAVRIPEHLDAPTAATLLCGGYVAYSALTRAGTGPGTRLAVVGFGGIGHLAVQYARGMGAEVTVVSGNPGKAGTAEELGAHRVLIDEPGTDFGRRLTDDCGGVDAIIVTSEAPGVLQASINGLAPYGTAVVVAASPNPDPVVAQRLLHYKLTVAGASQGPRHLLPEVFALHRRIGARAVVECFALADALDALQAVAAQRVRYRAVLVP